MTYYRVTGGKSINFFKNPLATALCVRTGPGYNTGRKQVFISDITCPPNRRSVGTHFHEVDKYLLRRV